MRNAEAPSMRADRSGDALERYLQIDLMRLTAWLRAGTKWIVLFTIAGFLLGAAYAMLAKPQYTVTTDILIDPSGLRVVTDDLFRQEGEQRDLALLSVESKRQTLVSRNVLMKVVQSLGLERDPEFVPPQPWTSAFSLRALLGGRIERPDPEIMALDNLEKRVRAWRDELSFVITLAVWSDNPEKSILISEAIVKTFRDELVKADAEGARRTADAMIGRIAELKDEVTAADRAVEEFRRANGLQSSQGELVSSRSMSQINQQLVAARERLIEAQSRYDDLTASGAMDAAAMQSPTISALRTQYATLKSRIDADSQVYGPRHPRITQQQIELRTLQTEIDAERGRITASARNNLDQAKAVVTALQAEAATVSSEVFTDNDAQVRLRDLMREAAAKTAIYEAFLSRATQIAEREQFDTTNMRVISQPVPPQRRSWPPSVAQLAAFGAIVGMVLSSLGVLAGGIWRDLNRPLPVPAPPSTANEGRKDEDDTPDGTNFAPATGSVKAPARRPATGSLLNLRNNSLLAFAPATKPDTP